MANLLTNEQKKIIMNEGRYRQVVAVVLLLEVLFVIAVIFNLTIWLSFRIQRQLSISTLSPNSQGSTLRDGERQRAESQIAQLASLWSDDSWSSILDRIIKSKNLDVKIDQIVGLWQEKNRTSSVVIYGQARSRQDLVAFVDAIKREKFFNKVDLPIESFLSTSKGRFTLNLEIKNND